jgi:hypothetical protein
MRAHFSWQSRQSRLYMQQPLPFKSPEHWNSNQNFVLRWKLETELYRYCSSRLKFPLCARKAFSCCSKMNKTVILSLQTEGPTESITIWLSVVDTSEETTASMFTVEELGHRTANKKQASCSLLFLLHGPEDRVSISLRSVSKRYSLVTTPLVTWNFY